jgi:hypothetical protein
MNIIKFNSKCYIRIEIAFKYQKPFLILFRTTAAAEAAAAAVQGAERQKRQRLQVML